MTQQFPTPGGLTSPTGGPPQGMMHSPQQRQMSPFSSVQSNPAAASAQWANQQRANQSMMAGGSMSQVSTKIKKIEVMLGLCLV